MYHSMNVLVRFVFIFTTLVLNCGGYYEKVYSQSSVSGHVRYLNQDHTAMDGVLVYLVSSGGQILDSNYTNQLGYFHFEGVQAGQYFVEPQCVKSWGGVNSVDALLVQKHFVSLIALTGLPLKAADVDYSGAVNSIDALQIMKRFVGMIDFFESGDWAFEHSEITVDGVNDVLHDFYGLCYGDINGTFTPHLCSPHPSVAWAGDDITESIPLTIPLNGNSPDVGAGKWEVLSGTGYAFSDNTMPDAAFSGMAGNSYLLTWSITTSCFTSVDTVFISFATQNGMPCPGLPSFVYGGQTYNTVQIGNQCWMRENLNIGTMLADYNSDTSTTVFADNGIIEKYCYNADPAFCEEYGGLYDWDELMQYVNTPASQGICPAGWHIPTINEYDTLINFLQGDTIAGSKLKETGLSHWNSPNLATNETGFSALGAGLHSSYGGTGGLKMVSYFWTSTLETNTDSHIKALDNGYAWMWEGYTDKYQGFSVRCLKNECPESPDQANAGPDQTIPGTIAQLAGNYPQSGQGSWSIVSGTGGVIEYYYDWNTQFTGLTGTTYTLVWTISTPCAQTSDTVNISFVGLSMNFPCPGIPTVVYGGQTYNTVQIGSQCWMKENLNIGSMISGALDQSDDAVIEKYCFDNTPDNCALYGGLYQWDEAMQYSLNPGAQGICPSGWHIPTEAEWCTLLTFLDPSVSCNALAQWTGTFIGDLLKEEGSTHWLFSSGTNASGFSATGSGYRYPNGQFYGLQVDNYTWSSELFTNGNAFNYSLMVYGSQISHLEGYRQNGHAVRCIKDIGSD